jgi:hypothetical protein
MSVPAHLTYMLSVKAVQPRVNERQARSKARIASSRRALSLSRERIDAAIEAMAESSGITGNDTPLTRHVARALVLRTPNAIARLYSEEVSSVKIGDRLAAEAWADVVSAAEEALMELQASSSSCAGTRRR